MIAVQVIALAISIINIFIVLSKGIVQNVCKFLSGVLVVASNIGYLAIALSQNPETALPANKLTCIGSSALMLLNHCPCKECGTLSSIIEESLGTQSDPALGKISCECRDSLEELYDDWKAAV